jgi:hypothetical protein
MSDVEDAMNLDGKVSGARQFDAAYETGDRGTNIFTTVTGGYGAVKGAVSAGKQAVNLVRELRAGEGALAGAAAAEAGGEAAAAAKGMQTAGELGAGEAAAARDATDGASGIRAAAGDAKPGISAEVAVGRRPLFNEPNPVGAITDELNAATRAGLTERTPRNGWKQPEVTPAQVAGDALPSRGVPDMPKVPNGATGEAVAALQQSLADGRAASKMSLVEHELPRSQFTPPERVAESYRPPVREQAPAPGQNTPAPRGADVHVPQAAQATRSVPAASNAPQKFELSMKEHSRALDKAGYTKAERRAILSGEVPASAIGDASKVGRPVLVNGVDVRNLRRACFVAGTPVESRGGLRAIDRLAIGDQVLSRHEETGEIAYRTVVRTIVIEDKQIYRLVVVDQAGNRETIRTTDEHPIWIVDHGWVRAADLREGDPLLTPSGDDRVVVSLVEEEVLETVYNIEVDEFHTYFVGESPSSSTMPIAAKLKSFKMVREAWLKRQVGLRANGASSCRF